MWPGPQDGDRRAQVRFRGVTEGLDQRMALEPLLHEASLDAPSAAVYQPDFSEARRVRCVHVFVDDRRDVPRREGMQIERRFDGNPYGVVHCIAQSRKP